MGQSKIIDTLETYHAPKKKQVTLSMPKSEALLLLSLLFLLLLDRFHQSVLALLILRTSSSSCYLVPYCLVLTKGGTCTSRVYMYGSFVRGWGFHMSFAFMEHLVFSHVIGLQVVGCWTFMVPHVVLMNILACNVNNPHAMLSLSYLFCSWKFIISSLKCFDSLAPIILDNLTCRRKLFRDGSKTVYNFLS